jgi:hypothetical protein
MGVDVTEIKQAMRFHRWSRIATCVLLTAALATHYAGAPPVAGFVCSAFAALAAYVSLEELRRAMQLQRREDAEARVSRAAE